MSSHAAAGLSVSASTSNSFHRSLGDTGQEPLHVHNACKARADRRAPCDPADSQFRAAALAFPRWASSAWSATYQACVGELFTLPSRGSDLRAICCYLGNVLRTLHGHICTRALTSSLFLAPACHWRLLWWCHGGFQYKSDCLSLVTLPALFLCRVCLCLNICRTGISFFGGGCFSVGAYF